jgi:hypothetical protein
MKRNPFRDTDMDLVAFIADLQEGQKAEHHLNKRCRELTVNQGLRHIVFFHDPGKYQIQAAYDTPLGSRIVSITGMVKEPEANIIHFGTKMIPLNPIYALFTGKAEIGVPRICTSALNSREAYDEALELLKEKRDKWMTPGVFEQAAELKKRRDLLPLNTDKTLKYNKTQ